ncbi:hypothetical protein [Aquibacillus sediminis]|uniref:hypothetical protein n=1 Tax=Aquibacillus sediminis TaxID=2574734 RepID=UPI001109FD9C|nr:hypothetical protein [Aquibacillus sediminis]
MRKKLGFVLAAIILIGGTIVISIQLSPRHQAKSAIDAFYSYEQEGKFAESWEMFHPQMKEKFEKGTYMEDRAHVFLNHFGVNTFSYTLSDVDKKSNWRMENGASRLSEVYEVTVTQTYKGTYGRFELSQPVYATEEEGEWKVLWDYKE